MRPEAQVSKAHCQKKSQENQEHFSCSPAALRLFDILEKIVEITRRRGMRIDTETASFAWRNGIVQSEKRRSRN